MELSIVNAPADTAKFESGETQTWGLENVAAVSDLAVSAPEGWNAEIIAEQLSVTAPAEDAEIFDQRVMLLSLTAIVKMRLRSCLCLFWLM